MCNGNLWGQINFFGLGPFQQVEDDFSELSFQAKFSFQNDQCVAEKKRRRP